MNILEAKYKCRLCGTVFTEGVCGEALALVSIVALTAKENYYPDGSGLGVHRYNVHRCNDCDFGFADFLGFEKASIPEPPADNKTPPSRWIPSENREFDEAYGIVCFCPDCGARVIGNYARAAEDECCSYRFCPYCGHDMRGASENDPHQ